MQQAFGLILYINRVLCVLVWKRSLEMSRKKKQNFPYSVLFVLVKSLYLCRNKQ